MSEAKGVALITGASSGIGALYADRLAAQGYDLILVARRADKLEQLAGRLRTTSGRNVETVAADLANPGHLAAIETILSNDRRITLLVNNAGLGSTAPALEADVDTMSEIVSLNVGALMRLSHAAIPAFVARRRGTIVNIASVVALAPERLNGVYGASKAFVLALGQALSRELEGTGVRVQTVLPGATATDFWDAAGSSIDHLPSEIVMRADDLVDAALIGLDRGESVTIPSLHDVKRWEAFEAARHHLTAEISSNAPASRYRAI